jgi:suppressor of G2 allele of SKP1
VRFRAPTVSEYEQTFPLANNVIPEQCKYHVGQVKLEMTLQKATKGPWKSLEKTNEPKDGPLSYPSSARVKHDWSEADRSAADEPPATADAFFKQIYANASEDTRRAMMKSFVRNLLEVIC